MAVEFDGGVVIGADSRTTWGYEIILLDIQKCVQMHFIVKTLRSSKSIITI